jgi:hypothetical protein
MREGGNVKGDFDAYEGCAVHFKSSVMRRVMRYIGRKRRKYGSFHVLLSIPQLRNNIVLFPPKYQPLAE